MTFSKFVGILHTLCNDGSEPAEFIKTLVDNFMVDPLNAKDAANAENDDYNPIANLEYSTRKSIANGNRNISKRNAKFILSHMDKVKFAEFISGYSEDSLSAVCGKIKSTVGITVDSESVGNVCATIYENILISIVRDDFSPQKIATTYNVVAAQATETYSEMVPYNDINKMMKDWLQKKEKNDLKQLEAFFSDANDNNSTIVFSFDNSGLDIIGQFCEQHSPLLICGFSGSGKTTFLQAAMLNLYSSKSCIFISLSDLYAKVSGGEISSLLNFVEIYNITNEGCIFFDGLNEMTSNGFDTSDVFTVHICDIVGELLLKFKMMKVFIAGRFSDKEDIRIAQRMFSPTFSILKLEGIPENDKNINIVKQKFGYSFSNLLRRPFYYNAYMNLPSISMQSSYNRFKLLDELYNSIFHKIRKDSISVKAFMYGDLPKLAYHRMLLPFDEPFNSEFDTIVGKFSNIIKRIDEMFVFYIDAENTTWFRFSHQDYRDFLATVYLKKRITDLSVQPINELISLNANKLSDDTLTMLIEAVCGFEICDGDFDPENLTPPDSKKNWWKKFTINNEHFNNVKSCIDIGFEIGYFLADPLRHPDIGNNVYFKGYCELINFYYKLIKEKTMGYFTSIYRTQWSGTLERVVRKEVELLRRLKKFDEAYDCLNELINYSSDNLQPALLHQKAKLLMYEAQYSVDSSKNKFKEGYELLQKCSDDGCLFSSNLLGRMFSAPSPIVTTMLDEQTRDVKKGFLYFFKVVETTRQKNELSFSEKYAYVQCAKMLLHNEIVTNKIIKQTSIIDENTILVGDRNYQPKQTSIYLADVLLKKANSNTPLAQYLSGIVSYYQQDFVSAVQKLKLSIARESAFGKILPALYLYEMLSDDNGLETAASLLCDLENTIYDNIIELIEVVKEKSTISDFEMYHPKYILEDIQYTLTWLNNIGATIKRKGVPL